MERQSIQKRIDQLFDGFNIEIDKRHTLVDRIHSLFYRLEKERHPKEKKGTEQNEKTNEIHSTL